jgi:hypothetical protein
MLNVAILLLMSGALALPQYIGLSYVDCTDCPNPSLYMCWGAGGNQGYWVPGTKEEVWCNWFYSEGWCAAYPGCTTVSSITVSRDTNSNYAWATTGGMCCSVP